MSRSIRMAAGSLLAVVSLAGVVHGVRAGSAQAMYFEAKYGAACDNPETVLELAEVSARLYPYSYRLCAVAAQSAYILSEYTPGEDGEAWLQQAVRWCDAGLALNPWQRELRLTKARLMAKTSAAEAAAFWEKHVDWNFWSPFNHVVRVELCARAGDFDKALESLSLLRGRAEHKEAREKLREAWTREQAPVSVGALPR